jgi:hypothetical protein
MLSWCPDRSIPPPPPHPHHPPPPHSTINAPSITAMSRNVEDPVRTARCQRLRIDHASVENSIDRFDAPPVANKRHTLGAPAMAIGRRRWTRGTEAEERVPHAEEGLGANSKVRRYWAALLCARLGTRRFSPQYWNRKSRQGNDRPRKLTGERADGDVLRAVHGRSLASWRP